MLLCAQVTASQQRLDALSANIKSALEMAKQTCSNVPSMIQASCISAATAGTKGLRATLDRVTATHKQLAANFLKRCSEVVTGAPSPSPSPSPASTKPSDNGGMKKCSTDDDCKVTHKCIGANRGGLLRLKHCIPQKCSEDTDCPSEKMVCRQLDRAQALPDFMVKFLNTLKIAQVCVLGDRDRTSTTTTTTSTTTASTNAAPEGGSETSDSVTSTTVAGSNPQQQAGTAAEAGTSDTNTTGKNITGMPGSPANITPGGTPPTTLTPGSDQPSPTSGDAASDGSTGGGNGGDDDDASSGGGAEAAIVVILLLIVVVAVVFGVLYRKKQEEKRNNGTMQALLSSCPATICWACPCMHAVLLG